MRRFGIILLVFLFSVLALVGGAKAVTLCLHQTGAHLATSAIGENDCGASACPCESGSTHECGGCVDVEVKGLDLGQLRFEKEAVLLLPPPAPTALIPQQQFFPPAAGHARRHVGCAPPAIAQASIVARTTVLLL